MGAPRRFKITLPSLRKRHGRSNLPAIAVLGRSSGNARSSQTGWRGINVGKGGVFRQTTSKESGGRICVRTGVLVSLNLYWRRQTYTCVVGREMRQRLYRLTWRGGDAICHSDTDDDGEGAGLPLEPLVTPLLQVDRAAEEVQGAAEVGEENESETASWSGGEEPAKADFIEDGESDVSIEPQEAGPSRAQDEEVIDIDADDHESTPERRVDRKGKGKAEPTSKRARAKGAPSNSKGKGKGRDDEDDEDDEIADDHPVFGLLTHPPFRADVIHRTLPDQVFGVKRLPLPFPGFGNRKVNDVRVHFISFI